MFSLRTGRKVIAATVAMLLVTCWTSVASAQFFTNQAAFVSNLVPGFYTEQFNGFGDGVPLNGTQTTYAAPGGGGFGWTATAPTGLYSLPGALSTNTPADPITFTFTGAPVLAFGGNFWGTNLAGDPILANVTFLASDGGTQTQTVSAPTFLGYISNVPLVGVSISAVTPPPGTANNWPTADNVITGTVPEPASLSLLAIGLLALARRRA